MKDSNKRIAKNTILLYFRMLLLMLVGLYTSRIILNALGIDDFGIYNVVGGVVSMFSIFSGSISVAISRFLTFELGTGDVEKLKKCFSTSINILAVIIILVLIVAESIGLWFLNEKMTIPQDRMVAANVVYQLSVLAFIVNTINIPYNASIIAHERMSAFAYISVLEAFIKLVIAYAVMFYTFDKLIFYAALICLTSLFIRLVYIHYCKRHFKECHYQLIFDKIIFKEMFGLAGWESIGSLSVLLKNQGGNILINLFFGPAVNAAHGVAMQVNNAITGFVTNFMMALNPQITKTYARKEQEELLRLIYMGARYSFYLMLILSLPVLINTHYILVVWLKLVPEHADWFVKLILIFALSETLSGTLKTAQTATGKIKKYKLIIGSINLTSIPISYVFLKHGYPPETVFITNIILSQISLLVRIPLLKGMVGISIGYFIKNVYANALVVFFISIFIPLSFYLNISENVYSVVLSIVLCVICSSITIVLVGMNSGERRNLFSIIRNRINVCIIK